MRFETSSAESSILPMCRRNSVVECILGKNDVSGSIPDFGSMLVSSK
jgi:hypothetical protein